MIRDVVSVRDRNRIHYRRLGHGPGMVIDAILRFVGGPQKA
ncbi:MAG TPA: hypothetical protein VET45_11625 [Candidatus Binatia bacterium]|nr:hypothetical protein [Candidatus Binatia bacterium]